MTPGFAATTQKPNISTVSKKTVLSTSGESEASQVEHQEYGFYLFIYCSLTRRALFIRNLFLQARWLPSVTAGHHRNG
jgi:hypothetical protein